MKHILVKTIQMLLLSLVILTGREAAAQDLAATINGSVTDDQGKPLAGVAITSANGRNGTSTNGKGEFAMSIDDASSTLVFSLYGFQDVRLSVTDKQDLNVRLLRDPHRKDEVIQLGYTSQKRSEITGSVATVKGDELERAPVANLTQTLPGRLAGLATYESFSELSRATTELNIRGLSVGRQSGPLVMIDGIINSYNSAQTLEYITANEIESITLLKDASTQALYGIQGTNGLLVVTTKRGRKGPLQIKTRFDESVQQVTTTPAFYSSADYAAMRNQAALNDGHGPNYLFSPAQIEGYRSGSNPELYPNNNWYKHFMKDFATMQRASMNVTGGNDKVQFYSNINFMHQGGQFKTDQTRYNANANNIWVNYRSNVDMNLNRYLKAFVRLSGNVKRERTPGAGNAEIYGSIFQLPPTMYGPVTQPVMDASGEVVDAGGQVITTERVASPTYGLLNRTGYVRHTVTNITSQFGLDLDMGFLTKGLNLTGLFAYQTNSVGSLATRQDYERWIRTNDSTSVSFVKKGAQNNTPLAYSKGHSYYYHLTYNIAANYRRDFGRHRIGAMAYMFYQNLTKAETDSARMLPYNRVSSGFEATYSFDSRYLLKFDLGYSGSEQYARGSRYTATPAISAGWVVSNESFLKNNVLVTFLKLRASYGKTANDMSSLARFAYLDNVTVAGGGPLAYLQYVVKEGQVGNPNIRAEVSMKQNYGLDLGIGNALTISADVFKERMSNMIISALSTIPEYQGIPLENYPRLNTGTFENKGVDLTVNYSRTLGKDLSFHVGGLLGYARNKVVNWNEALRTADYAYRKWEEGYSFGQEFGYLVDYSNGNGFFNSQADIDNAGLAYNFGTPRPGDLRYRDLNADGKIDERDKAPIGNGMPRTSYGISGGITYRALELNVLFQGVGKYMTIERGQGVYETDYDGVFGELHRNAWTPERYAAGEKITSPALSLGRTVNHEASDFYASNRSYLRLKNVELAYTLPLSLSKVILAEKIRILLSGQNLITWDKMKSSDYGPEGTYATFPVYRVFNAGISVIF
ncbi:SusC/RagA family TonB-linked outer membrane protein [Dyadobacter sandarakinus]|uniref:SusC/RagA family TonB-linked outer membrane protein n=1 Tax=Dyadobacter sandarakinus TaxID=2747268 RepID=A0ABX7I9Q1_9BACT|nr:SusC/RagA family TonB-linked outer membrane protein [Dyadobacter sandarakinus]QRR02157.1 SusC/RagA family TonB-linked outer membrane protein [Dyadobacter sandarakinus]